MDKICEFCTQVEPMVYCHADAAYLCLSCDAKVHSANEVSNRHLRSLLCDSCRHLPASARCADHRMFVCRSCDESLHSGMPHRRRPVSSYVGCPSANDFAALWGLELAGRQKSERQDSCFVLKQILGLKSLQDAEESDATSVVRERGEGSMKGFFLSDQSSLQDEALKDDTDSALRFPESDTPSFASTLPNHLVGEPFWQFKSPTQAWGHSLQDHEVCEYVVCHKDLDIPDVDTSFSNFEDLFKGDES